ncbi:UNVERIFIED_CONTAM: hypothetical protein RMT77_009076 [Armadillidium vulgare]
MSGKFTFGQKVTLEVPPYNDDDPVLWFYLLEILFRRANIDTSFDKYELTILSLGSDKAFSLLHEMRDFIFEQTNLTSQPYETLKSTIIKRALEPELLKLVKELETGNLKPTKYLQRIKCMFGHPWNADLDLKEMFTLNLPSPLHKLVNILGQEESLEVLAASLDSVFESVIQPSNSDLPEDISSKVLPSEKGEECKSNNAEAKRKLKKKRKTSRGLPCVFPKPIKTSMQLLDEKVHWYNVKEKQVNYKSYSRYMGPSFIGPFRIS